MDCIIHIGTEKTGTTSIQRTLDAHAELLLDHGVFWPPILRAGQDPRIACYAMDDDVIDLRKRRRDLTTPEAVAKFRTDVEGRLTRELKQAKEARDIQNLLIVNEHLSRLQSPSELMRLKALLEPFVDRIRIVLYLRRQDRLMRSMFSQVIKIGGTRQHVFPQRGTAAERDFVMFNYRRIVDLWSDAFGREAVTIRVFERERLHQGDVVADFFQAAELTDLPDMQTARVNESLSAQALLVMRELNRHLPREARGHLGPLSGQLFAGSGMPVARGEAQTFLEAFQADNDHVARVYLGRDHLFEPIGDTDYPDTVDPDALTLSPQMMAWHFAQLWEARNRKD